MNEVKKEKLTIHLPISMKREIKAVSARTGVSTSQTIEYLIAGALLAKEEILEKLLKGTS